MRASHGSTLDGAEGLEKLGPFVAELNTHLAQDLDELRRTRSRSWRRQARCPPYPQGEQTVATWSVEFLP